LKVLAKNFSKSLFSNKTERIGRDKSNFGAISDAI